MKTSLSFAPGLALAAAVLCLATPAQAQLETARVISSTPVMQQVPVNRQVCQDEAVTQPGQKSGAGALMGTIAGGALGNAVGEGGGKTAATVIGLVGGALLGNRIEGESPPQTQFVKRCYPQTSYESRVSGYLVVYEFGGKQYSVQMPSDPGQYLQLQITPVLPAPAVAPMPPRPAYYR